MVSTHSILIVCASYPPVMGGSEIEVQRVAAALAARGHKVRVLCSGGDPMPAVRDWVDPFGVPVSILTRNASGFRKNIEFAARVAVTLISRRKEYDLVYFLMQGLHLAAGLPVCRALDKAIILKISGDGIITAMRKSRAGRLELHWLRKWRIPVMLLNDNMMQEAESAGVAKAQTLWMPNPVDVGSFRPATVGERESWRLQHRIPAKDFCIIYSGRLSDEKGVRQLFAGFQRAAMEIENARLILVGDGPMRKELESLAVENGLARRILFVGRVETSEVPFWLRSADAFALTSPNEGFSCSLVEAMASGLPCVVSDIAANRQLVQNEKQGLTVPYDSIDAVARAIVRLARDPTACRRMGDESRITAEEYSTDRVVDRYESVFDTTLADF